ncbi:MAG: serine/threonine-protein kinase, partial [Myxococcota bacterium]|nr:serine/threonine-protein kinase [Myxococcota bacterium]
MTRRFTSVGLLGTGGQGRVFAVQDAARGGAVLALKERSVDATAELREEFELLCRLRHPHIAAVHDWLAVSPLAGPGEEVPCSAYTQDLVKGTDLFTALRDATPEQRAAAFEQVFMALAYLHALNVVHLDLKPDNVLVDLDDSGVTARVLDFGVARRGGTATEQVIGSRSYVAPERLRGDPVDPRADLFAVGVMMAEVSSRQPLSLYQHPELADADARRAHLQAMGVQETWLDAVVALTAFEPAERPGSVYEAVARFEQAIHRPVALQTPATVAAILRAGAPVGHEAAVFRLFESAAQGQAHVLVGPHGIGRRTLARQVARRLQLAGHVVEAWPGAAESQSTAGFAAAIERLIAHDAGLAGVVVERTEPQERATGVDAATIERQLRGTVTAVAERLLETPSRFQRPLLVVEQFEDAPWPVRMLVELLVEASEEGTPLPFGLLVIADAHGGSAATPVSPLTRDDVAVLLD